MSEGHRHEEDRGYTRGTYPDLNNEMTPEQRAAFIVQMRGEEVGLTEGGTVYIVEQAMSVQSVEEAIRLRQERETNLGS